MKNIVRIVRAAAAGAVAWWVGLNYIFGAAQVVLADPDMQSAKMNAIYELQPPARIAADPWLLPLAMLVIAFIQTLVFACIRSALPSGLVLRGLAFGGVAWALFVPWFEFYIPWSLMLEPTALVLLEMLCWAGVLGLVGTAISLAFGRDAADVRNASEQSR
jgi:hypothetical protein